MKSKLSMLSAFCLLSVACSDGPDRLTDAQKAQFYGVTESTGNAVESSSAASKSKKTPEGNTNPVETDNVLKPTSTVLEHLKHFKGLNLFAAQGKPSSKVQPMVSALEDGECTFSQSPTDEDMDFLKDLQNGSSFELKFSVTGAACPVTMDFGMSFKASGRTANLKANMSYNVNDEDFKKLNDVTGLSLNFNVEGSENEMNLSGGGKIVSQKHGALPVKFEGSLSRKGEDSAVGSFTMEVTFPEFVAVLTVEMDGEKQKLLLNGEEIKPEDLRMKLAL